MRVFKNPDDEFRKAIEKQLKAKNGYCPCAIQHTPDTRCMCKAFREQIDRKEPGACHCGLYILGIDDEV